MPLLLLSDEAIPVLLSNPEMYSTLPILLILKFGIAVLVGYIVDFIFKPDIIKFENMEEEDIDEEDYEETAVGSSCPCCYTQYPLIVSALLRSLKIFAFIFVTTFIFTGLIEWIGEENLQAFLLTDSVFQPIFAACFWLYSKLCCNGHTLPVIHSSGIEFWIFIGWINYQCWIGNLSVNPIWSF